MEQLGRFIKKGINARNLQRQSIAVENLSFVNGSHQLKFGVDYRRLSPITGLRKYLQFVQTNLTAAQSGNATSVQTQGNIFGVNLLFTNLSLYDKIRERYTAPHTDIRSALGVKSTAFRGAPEMTRLLLPGVDNLATLALAPQGTPLYKMTYNNFAPRVGLAYQLFRTRQRDGPPRRIWSLLSISAVALLGASQAQGLPLMEPIDFNLGQFHCR